MDTASRHLLLELHGCDAAAIDDIDVVRSALFRAAAAAGARVVAEALHEFRPQGVTGVVLIEESHLAIHTWPETGYVAVDCFTCGSALPEAARAVMVAAFAAERSEAVLVLRGRGPATPIGFERLP